MSTSKPALQRRISADASKQDSRDRSSATQSPTKATHRANSGVDKNSEFSMSNGVRLTHYPVQSLTYLQEILRPSAASRVAAAARMVHMETEHTTTAVASSSNSGSESPAVLLAPPSYAVAASTSASTPQTKGEEDSSGRAGPPVSRGSSYRNPLEDSMTSQPTVPSLTLLLECTTQLSALLAQWRACTAAGRRDPSGRPPQAPPPPAASANEKGTADTRPSQQPQPLPQSARPSSLRILELMNIILWYCLSTADSVRLAYGGRSHNTSGRATPALTGVAAAADAVTTTVNSMLNNNNLPPSMGGSSTPYGVRSGGGRGSRAGSIGRSSSADAVGATNWLEGRMSSSSTASSVCGGVPTVILSDDQVAEHLFRPAVDAVVLLQDRPSDSKSTAQKGKGGKVSKSVGSGDYNEENLSEELQTVALWMLAAVLVRFPDAPFNATVFLPVLFPQVDVRGVCGAAIRHPILQPLLRGGETPAQPQQQKESSIHSSSNGGNTSMRCGAGAALTALLHKLQPTLLYAEEPHPNRQAFISLATQCGTILLSIHESLCWGLENEVGNSATPLLSTYAAVVGVTPYNRCPRSRAVVLQALQLPVLQSYLAHEKCAEYVPTTLFALSVFKNESMRGAATQLFANNSTTASSNNDNSNNKGGAEVCSGTLLSALLQHADTRVEVWRCMVPLSRLYPRMVHGEFDLLMSASVRVVATLTNWEATEDAAGKAALEEKAAEGEASGETGNVPQQQQWSESPTRTITTFANVVTSDRAAHRNPNANSNADTQKEEDKEQPAVASATCVPHSSLFTRIRPPPSTPPEALAECLRTWVHFMGYVWKPFDDNACDPALSPECQQDRATLAQKQRIHEEVLRPAMRLRRCGEDVRTMTLRAIAQIGNGYVATITDRAVREELVQYVQSCIADPQPRVRGEALTTLGMWLWQYPSMDEFACEATDNAVHSLTIDPNALVRTKAAFALSNITGRLPEGTCPVVREAPDYIATLCATAMHAAVADSESGVQGHGIRMMNHLLQALDFDELISEVAGFEEGVAEGFLRVLLECLRAPTRGYNNNTNSNQRYHHGNGAGWYAAPREAKHRWNAACALGMGLARKEVFDAEPKYALEAVDALCTAVVRDHIFKVRTQAAGALGRIPVNCLSATYSTEDLTPRVVRALCEALESAASTENFRQYKEQGSLRDVLRSSLAQMITTAKSSIELDKVFTSYQKLLQKEQLL